MQFHTHTLSRSAAVEASRKRLPGRVAQSGRRSRGRSSPQLSLALQGGGSFGAFTWGVLDLLLERNHPRLDMVSGASAGAINATALASGLAEGGPDAARRRLANVWTRVRDASRIGPLSLPAPSGLLLDALQASTQFLSPYQLNPLNKNPLRDILEAEVDFERLRASSPVRLLIAATRVRDGQLRLFREHELTLDAVLASSCLPQLHQAVEIDGEAYWDGGYSANPPLRQLAHETEADDILLVQIMPEDQDDLPRTPRDIARRLSEMAFNAALRREVEALDDLRACCEGPWFAQSRLARRMRRLRLHHLDANTAVPDLRQHSMLDTGGGFLTALRDAGRQAASDWLASGRQVDAAASPRTAPDA